MVQDVLFGLRRLVDTANRAIFPAVNDPYTAIQAVHHLTVLLCSLARRRLGDRLCRDRQATLRVTIPLPDFAEYLVRSTAQIRRFGAAEPAVTRSLIQLLRERGSSTVSQDRRAACAHHLWLVLEDAKRETAQPADLQAVLEDGAAALSALGADHPQTEGCANSFMQLVGTRTRPPSRSRRCTVPRSSSPRIVSRAGGFGDSSPSARSGRCWCSARCRSAGPAQGGRGRRSAASPDTRRGRCAPSAPRTRSP